MFAATVVAGLSAPMLGAYAASETRGVDVHDPDKGGFVVPSAEPPNRIDISIGDEVKWTVWEGKHNITPKDKGQWGGNGSDAELTPESTPYGKVFNKANDYFYFCSIHSSADDVGKQGVGMWGVVHVIDPTSNTTASSSTSTSSTTPPTAPSTTGTTRPGPTTPATTATVPTTRPAPAAPAPTTSTAKGDKDKKPKDETTTTTTAPPPPVDLPDSAIIPTLPGASTPSPEPEAPTDTPEGDPVALLKPKKGNGGDAMMLLIVSGLGLGALGVGTAGYKYANRSSKYFPA
jgi:plastocyanin